MVASTRHVTLRLQLWQTFRKTSLRTAQRRIRRSVPRNKVLLDDMDTCMHARRGQVAWIGRFA